MRGVFAVFLLAVAVIAARETADAGQAPPFGPALGDTDCNGAIEPLDALSVLQFEAALHPVGGCLLAADVSCDKDVTPVDALLILRNVAGFPPPGTPTECGDIGHFNKCGDPSLPADGAYLALGDSLTEGVGASDRDQTAFVPQVHACLGPGFELINLGHSGDTSSDLIFDGHLDDAIKAIGNRRGNADPADDVRLITLGIGGNDLLDLYFDFVLPGTCDNLDEALNDELCTSVLDATLHTFEGNLGDILDPLTEAAGDDATIVLLTMYNPSLGNLPVADLALDGLPGTAFPEGLNDTIRSEAIARGLPVAEVFPRFKGRQFSLISSDLIHPNDRGYDEITAAVLGAMGIATP